MARRKYFNLVVENDERGRIVAGECDDLYRYDLMSAYESDCGYAYDECVSLFVLRGRDGGLSFKVHGHAETVNHENVAPHAEFDVRDGIYSLFDVCVPDKVWYDAWLDMKKTAAASYELYFTDGGRYYKVDSADRYAYDEVTVADVAEAAMGGTESNLTVHKADVVSLGRLWRCYLGLCRKVFDKECSREMRCGGCGDEDSRNRDLLWLFLNVLKYLIKGEMLDEAGDLLDRISGCTAVCPENEITGVDGCGCGS